MLYRLLKIVVTIGIRLYYREIKVLNRKKLNSNGPCIILANHPNTLMDAWVIGNICKQPIHYMAKATLFDSPFKQRILRSLNMIPINRRGEGQIDGVKNTDSFEACYQLLEAGKTLVIFPEGSSHLERKLRELKTGAARIALEAENRNGGKLGLQIIPLGLNYLQADRFRSDILIQVGNPLEVTGYLEDYRQNAGHAAKKLTEQVRIRLEQLLVNSDIKENEKLTEELHTILTSKYIKTEERGVEGEVKLIKQIRDALTEIAVTHPWKLAEIQGLLVQIQWQLNKFEIRADFLDRRFRSRMFFRQILVSIVFLLVGLPLFLFGLIHNVVPYKVTDLLIPKLTREVEYYAPIAVLLGLVLYPLTYVGFVLLAKYGFGLGFWPQLAYFAALPLSGLFAFSFNRYLKHIAFKWKFVFLMVNNKQVMLELQHKKQALRNLLFGE
jgi:1-acyl-sn-glycerol-3-phosphate acyltransferase